MAISLIGTISLIGRVAGLLDRAGTLFYCEEKEHRQNWSGWGKC